MLTLTNLALRFALEIAGLAAAGYAANALVDGPLRWPATVAAPVALAVFWGLVVAPNATNGLAPHTREVIGSAALLVAAAAVALAGRPVPAAVLAGLVVANTVVLLATPAEVAR